MFVGREGRQPETARRLYNDLKAALDILDEVPDDEGNAETPGRGDFFILFAPLRFCALALFSFMTGLYLIHVRRSGGPSTGNHPARGGDPHEPSGLYQLRRAGPGDRPAAF